MPPLQPPEIFFPDFPTTLQPPPPPPPIAAHRHSPLLPPILAATVALSFFVLFAIIYRKLSNKRTAPVDLKPSQPQRFPYSVLRRATASFSSGNRLGQGGFGSVYKGVLPSGQEVAVKVMDASGSLQGELEFHNELSLASRIDAACCPHVVSILGFSSDDQCRSRHHRRRRLVLVYEYMQNGNLQEALLDRKCPELMLWKKRFSVILSVAKGIDYLHNSCDPPIVHGDIKPSNILLDLNFDAKISDFGLAQVLSRDVNDIEEVGLVEDEEKIDKERKGEGLENGEDRGSIVEENESVVTEEVVLNVVDQSLETCVKILDGESGGVEASPSEGLECKTSSISDGFFDRVSVESDSRRGIGRKRCETGKDWWWKQENVNGGSESGRIRDYVMEWLGSEIKKERPKKDWIASSSKGEEDGHKPWKQRKKLEWWASLDEDKLKKERKNRKPREWWKEEFCEELSKKVKKKKRELKSDNGGEMWGQRDEDEVPDQKKRKSRGSRGSIDWWLDGFSGEFRIGRRNSQDWASGDIPKSGGISSTPSMRGTVCYIAPEYGGGGQLSEKCDIYSFGVLLLVLVSGRRPLQVTASPMSEFERANLISWARQLAHSGKLLDLVDTTIQMVDREQSLLCITIALLCLQRSPNKRPTIEEIVGMLSGESEPPHLPFEFSPSPPSNFYFKSRKKAR